MLRQSCFEFKCGGNAHSLPLSLATNPAEMNEKTRCTGLHLAAHENLGQTEPSPGRLAQLLGRPAPSRAARPATSTKNVTHAKRRVPNLLSTQKEQCKRWTNHLSGRPTLDEAARPGTGLSWLTSTPTLHKDQVLSHIFHIWSSYSLQYMKLG